MHKRIRITVTGTVPNGDLSGLNKLKPGTGVPVDIDIKGVEVVRWEAAITELADSKDQLVEFLCDNDIWSLEALYANIDKLTEAIQEWKDEQPVLDAIVSSVKHARGY